jgi:hypothetical protein
MLINQSVLYRSSDGDPDPLIRGTEPAPDPDPSRADVERTEIMLEKYNFS